MPINDSAKFELNASENVLREMRNTSFSQKMKIYIQGFLTDPTQVMHDDIKSRAGDNDYFVARWCSD